MTYERIVAEERPVDNADGTIDGFWVPTPDFRLGPRQHVVSTGLPFRSLCFWFSNDDRATGHDTCVAEAAPFRVDLPKFGQRAFPWYPVWPGFALNTLFYAAIAWGVWQIPCVFRRSSRRRFNRCGKCGYDRTGLAANAVCPECGAAWTPAPRVS